jgi:hypothetical protein
MKRIFVPSLGATDWRKFLADPDTQWRREKSAMELAVSWERAQRADRGLPPEVAKAIDSQPDLQGSELLLALPEHKVPLKGRGKPSQNDVWALLRKGDSYVSMTVEGKAGEPFATTLGEWLLDGREGKRDRLEHLCQVLQSGSAPPPELRYQLFHRTASSVIEAHRFGARFAVMLVQSFQEDPVSWKDYGAFCSLLGTSAIRGSLVEARRTGPQRLFLGWVDSKVATDNEIAAVV